MPILQHKSPVGFIYTWKLTYRKRVIGTYEIPSIAPIMNMFTPLQSDLRSNKNESNFKQRPHAQPSASVAACVCCRLLLRFRFFGRGIFSIPQSICADTLFNPAARATASSSLHRNSTLHVLLRISTLITSSRLPLDLLWMYPTRMPVFSAARETQIHLVVCFFIPRLQFC